LREGIVTADGTSSGGYHRDSTGFKVTEMAARPTSPRAAANSSLGQRQPTAYLGLAVPIFRTCSSRSVPLRPGAWRSVIFQSECQEPLHPRPAWSR
jgi:hypothetical protein